MYKGSLKWVKWPQKVTCYSQASHDITLGSLTKLVTDVNQLWKISGFSPPLRPIDSATTTCRTSLLAAIITSAILTRRRLALLCNISYHLLLFLRLVFPLWLQLERRIIILTGLTGRGRRAGTWIVTCVKGRTRIRRRRRSRRTYQCVLL